MNLLRRKDRTETAAAVSIVVLIISTFLRDEYMACRSDLTQRIGDTIAHGEGNYESYNTGTKGVPDGRVGHSFVRNEKGTVTDKTINEILHSGDTLSGLDPKRMFATGKYQTIVPTLRAARDALGLTGAEKYDAEMQERVFRDFLLRKAGDGALFAFIHDGVGSIDDAQLAAAKEWASIAVPNGRTINDGSLSYYESNANHANAESTSRLREILVEIEASRS